MKFLFFLTLSALIGALYALYAPSPTKVEVQKVSQNESELAYYRKELASVEGRLQSLNESIRLVGQDITRQREELRTRFEDISSKNPSLLSSGGWTHGKPEESPIITDWKSRPNVLGFGGMEMLANKIRQQLTKQSQLTEEAKKVNEVKSRLVKTIKDLTPPPESAS